MHTIFIISLSLVFFYIFLFKTKNTIFEISWKHKSFFSLLIGREILIYVVLGCLIVEFTPVYEFDFFYVSDHSKSIATYYILFSVIFLFIFLIFFSKKLFKSKLKIQHLSSHENNLFIKKEKRVLSIVIAMLFSLIILLHLFGLRHAFIDSVRGGYDLIEARMANRYAYAVPTVFRSYLSFLIYLGAAFYGLLYRALSRRIKIMYAFLICYSSLFLGAKGPFLIAFLVFFFSYLTQVEGVPLRKILPRVLLSVGIFLIFTLIIVNIQFANSHSFTFYGYFVNRLGVGQIQGVYEQFGIKLKDKDYILYAIPFANYITDIETDQFNKDLMMSTFGRRRFDARDIGVMNSFFIGEALAIGGIPLVIFSPLIVAFNYVLIVVSLSIVFQKFFGIPFSRSRFVIQVFVPAFVAFTGDLGGLIFFKANIMILVFFAPVIMVYSILLKFHTDNRAIGFSVR